MKKALFIISVAMIGMLATSCNKSKTCKCQEYINNQVVSDPAIVDPETQAVKNCSALTDKYNTLYGGGGVTYKCEKL